MSIRIMTLVWELDLPDSDKLVLLALADCANDEGYCWPGMLTLAHKCSKSERTVQYALRRLEEAKHLSRREVRGRGCEYMIHPRKDCTPAEDAPPQGLRETPATVAPDPRKDCTQTVRNRKEPSKSRRVKKPIPDDWQPREFGEGTQSRQVVDSWPAGEQEAQLEQFKANHRAKGNTFLDPQDAWSTWVLNTRKFGIGRPAPAKQYISESGYVYRGSRAQVKREAHRRRDLSTYWAIEGEEMREREARAVGSLTENIMRRAGNA